MKKITLLTLVFLTTLSLIAQEKQFSVSTNNDQNSIWINEDTINLVAPTVLVNGEPIGTGDGGPEFDASVYNLLWSYNADSAAATGSDDYMFRDAFQKGTVIWIPWRATSEYVIKDKVVIPEIRKLIFEVFAVIDVQGELKGNKTVIEAEATQIFTKNSNLSTRYLDWSKSMDVYPEWFGAIPDSVTDCTPGLQKCLDVFGQNVQLKGFSYRFKGTVILDEANSIFMNAKTLLLPDPGTNGSYDKDPPMFKILKEPFVIDGGVVWCEDGYNGWIFDVEIERDGNSDYKPRYASRISNMIIKGFSYGAINYAGLAYNGIKIKSQEYNDYSYFSVVDNVDFRYSDTAIFLSGHPESGMSNSWHWSNIAVDWTMHGIILDSRAAGHVFTNLIMQPNKKIDTLHLIDVAGKYNSFHGMIWDCYHMKEIIIIREGATNNWFSNMGLVEMYANNVKDYNPKMANAFSTATPFDPTTPTYQYYTDERISIGYEENHSVAPQLSVLQKDYTTVANFIAQTSNITRGGLDRIAATYPSLTLVAQSVKDDMDKGFGTGIAFLNKDTNTVYNAYTTNIMGRILARSEDNDSDTKGMLQFWTKGTNPAITIRNTGAIGVGTYSPDEFFEIEFPNDTDGKPDPNIDIELGQGSSNKAVTFITLRSPDGSKYYVTVDDSGVLQASSSKP